MFANLKRKLLNSKTALRYIFKYTNLLSFSQYGEDKILDFAIRILLNKGIVSDINYLDIGGCLPYSSSNTFFLYRQGYRGVVIEADPELAKNFKRERKEDIVLNIGITPEKTSAGMSFYYADGVCGSFRKDNVTAALEKLGLKNECKSREIPVRNINDIMDEYFAAGTLTLLSIDVEGLDKEILSGFCFEKYQPLFLCVETAELCGENFLGQKSEEINHLLKSKGYKIYADTYVNTIFIREDILEKMYS